MYQTIVMAYDGSQTGREALRQGADLAVLCQARVVLLAVVPHDLGITLAESATPSDLPHREYEEVHNLLQTGAATLRTFGLKVTSHLAVGNPAEVIGQIARAEGADLIVVGHREKSALARWWRGATDASLLAHAPCTLLVAVPPHSPQATMTA